MAGKRPLAHGPANCSCVSEVRRSALDALIDLPPLHKNQQLKPRYTHDPQEFFFVLACIFLECVLTHQPAYLVAIASGEISYLNQLLIFFSMSLCSNRGLSELSSRRDTRINLFLIKYKQQIVENVI